MARRRRHEEHENHERWLVSYADFITLLFAFFTVLYATAERNETKEQEFESSVRKSFNMASAGLGGLGVEVAEMMQPALEGLPSNAGREEVRDYVEGQLEKEMGDETYKATIEGVRHDAVGVRIQLAASAIFPSGSANLLDGAITPLDRIGEMLKKTKKKIIVEGHTDNIAIRTAQYPSNWELSAARATKIVRYFMYRHKIESGRMTAVAYADQRPLVPNTSEANRAKNRRIEILIVMDEKRSAY